jgi:hypothetical protein
MKRCPSWTPLFLSLSVAAGYGCPAGNAIPSPTPPVTTPPPTTTVKVDVVVSPTGGESCLNVPAVTKIHNGDSLSFNVSGIEAGQEVEIDFLPAYGTVANGSGAFLKGPFPRDASNPKNPYRGRYRGDDKTNTQTTASDHFGYWTYQVALHIAKGGDVDTCDPLDPGLIVKN